MNLKSINFLRKILQVLFPDLLIELIARSLGWFVDILRTGSGLGIESIIRAKLLNAKFGFAARDIGRNVIFYSPKNIVIKEGVSLHNNITISACGKGFCQISEHTHISQGTVLAAGAGLFIGRGCAISSGVAIYTASNFPQQKGESLGVKLAKITIGDNVLIGANSVLLPGASIGQNSVVGAGAVCAKPVVAFRVVAGVPAKTLRTLGKD